MSVYGEIDVDSVESQMESLASGSTIKFTAEIDGVDREITAIKNQDGSISYTANVDGVNVPVEVKEKDGKVTFKADTTEVDAETQKTDGGSRVTNYLANTSQLINSFPPITRTVNYVAKGAGAAALALGAHLSTGTLLSPAHADGTAYNMLNLKPAYADGKVSLSKDENALVNELGTESIIRNGVWSLLPGGMHVHSLKKGDIVLSADQTKDLLNSGKTNGHARAYADGTLMNAYANGWRIPSGSSKKSSSSKSKNTKKSANKVSKSASSASKATSDALDALADYFDWVEINMKRLARLSEIAENAIDRAIGLSAKQASTSNAIRSVQNEKSIAQAGANKYLSHANWYASQSGLSTDLQNRVKNGTIDISKYDENTQKKIKEYQDWYEKYLDAYDKVTELQEKETELALRRLENIEDFYDLVVDVHESLQEANDSAIELNDSLGFSAVSESVKKVIQSSIDEAEKIYENKLQQLSNYESEFNSLISSGYIKQGSDEELLLGRFQK